METDAHLFKAMVAGDQQSATTLINRYRKPLANFLKRYTGNDFMLSEDIQQDAWMKAIRNHELFDEKKSFQTWLFTIAGRLCIDSRRMDRIDAIPCSQHLDLEESQGSFSFDNNLPDPGPSPLIAAVIQEGESVAEQIARGMGKLDEITADCIHRHISGEPYHKIGESYGHLHRWALMRVRAGVETLRENFRLSSDLVEQFS